MRITLDDLSEEQKKGFRHGISLFNDKHFWDAHEAWEDVWHELAGDRKIYVQGLIQAAAAFVHVQKKNSSAIRSMAVKALDKLLRFELDTPVDLVALRVQLEHLASHGTLSQDETPVELEITMLE